MKASQKSMWISVRPHESQIKRRFERFFIASEFDEIPRIARSIFHGHRI